MNEMLIAINAVSDVLMNTGIYPASAIKNYGTPEQQNIPRTTYQDGWNACLLETMHKTFDALEKLEKGIDPNYAILSILDVGSIDKDKFVLNLNDIFFYASADNETITKDEAKEIVILFRKYGFKGVVYWVSEKRKYDPEIPIYKKDVEEVRKLEKE